ncbi:hypothetical protein IGI04_020308 [Brassica rapa subsp. trilocularis]|uniref:Alanyl-transfer RNA synthetases family profile domain-containing protein n=1 Tax=Brassica rapa subsp. trilocularis TaxID=1813537 RepID=A0ABQ7MID5_BRACM|nr:hypothetical protein IGI04_020308 [Brassica rapa subsp. trilocularis]
MDSPPTTKLDYHVDMFKLQSQATFLSLFKAEDGRIALILDSTVFHPQGGGQPSDTGLIEFAGSDFKFSVQDVRSKDGIVLHYGVFQGSAPGDIEKGEEVHLLVDESRRKLNSRQGKLNRSCSLVLHSAGHLLDLCMQKVGLGHLEPAKGYHFPDGPFVEYKGVVPQAELLVKQKELEAEANELISKGGKVYADILPYEEASLLCGGTLPDYIPKGSTPRVLRLGENPGCPCGGTHVSDISDIISMKITQMRTKKGMTKVLWFKKET